MRSQLEDDGWQPRGGVYSERDEQQFLLSFFEGKDDGLFVDVGANDGRRGSNTRALFERGWRGVCVEADPETFKYLQKTYADEPRVLLFNNVVWDRTGNVNFYQHQSFCAGLSTVWPSYPGSVKVEVESTTLDVLLERAGASHVDFLAIDAEGCDVAIINAYSFKLRPSVIMLEYPGDVSVSGIVKKFSELQYDLVFRNVANIAFNDVS